MDEIETAILRTIEYARQFGSTISRREAEERLIGGIVWNIKEVRKKIESQISSNQDFNPVWLSKKVELAREMSEKLVEQFSDILMIGITGSVATGHPKKGDDIDLMVVTKNNRLWLTRLIVWLWLKWNRYPCRKPGQVQKENEFCFNLWMEADCLEVPDSKKNLRTAVDLILMKPVINKLGTYERFLSANKWVEKYVINGYRRLIKHNRSFAEIKEKPNIIFYLINRILYKWQYWYMKSKITTEIVETGRAYFHPETNKVYNKER